MHTSTRIATYNALSHHSSGGSMGDESFLPMLIILGTLGLIIYMIYLSSKTIYEYLDKENK